MDKIYEAGACPIMPVMDNTNDVISKNMPCSPFPSAPRYREITTAISRLNIAEITFVDIVFAILLSIGEKN